MHDLSIIVPVFRDQSNLNICLDAIISQASSNCDSLEIVVVNNDPGTKIELPNLPSLEIKVVNCLTPGSYAARNTGADAARGRYLIFLDADCVPDTHWLEQCLYLVSQQEAPDVVGGEVDFIVSERPSGIEAYQAIVGFGQKENILFRRFSATANLLVRRAAFLETGPFNERLLSGGDREWCWRAFQKGFEVEYDPELTVRTNPRRRFSQALVQTRRVAGGRARLSTILAEHKLVPKDLLEPEKDIYGKIGKIFQASRFSLGLRLRAFLVAIVLKVVHDVERIRVRLGGQAERR
ncbi:glycosyltransferase [Marinobacter sp. TBZ242]|uniref:Glycosyltransferase n=1 Tax=Marinobacter azerbaijanicus TaxID=3050455 RepID=A0ABT7ICY3_9GAMM|nr:glycosyltransferase [Marinobacter sp. TBZ242]MDL0432011.1 glycosyltransferase [Marinobacter sp. TBZ242]